jgi:amino acid transporter
VSAVSITFDPNRRLAALPFANGVVRLRVLLVRLAPIASLILIEPWFATATILAGIWRRLDRTLTNDGDGATGSSINSVQRHTHVLAAASNLLGICLIIIGGLKLTNSSSKTYSDEVAWVAAFCMLASIFLSYTRLRDGRDRAWRIRMVDWFFLCGVGLLIVSMLCAAYQL